MSMFFGEPPHMNGDDVDDNEDDFYGDDSRMHDHDADEGDAHAGVRQKACLHLWMD